MAVSRNMIVPPDYVNVPWVLAACDGDVFDDDGKDRFYSMPNEQDTKLSARLDETKKALCARCQILTECREYALANEKFGLWGGMTPREREKWHKKWNR